MDRRDVLSRLWFLEVRLPVDAMPRLADSWTAMHVAYSSGTHAGGRIAAELAAICIVMRDAEWAKDVQPFCSHDALGLTTGPDYWTARRRRTVWIKGGLDGKPVVTFQDGLGSVASRDERPVDLSEATLEALVNWLRAGNSPERPDAC
jgi:hypothetical protein